MGTLTNFLSNQTFHTAIEVSSWDKSILLFWNNSTFFNMKTYESAVYHSSSVNFSFETL